MTRPSSTDSIPAPRGPSRALRAIEVDYAESDEEKPFRVEVAKARNSDAMSCDGDEYKGGKFSDGEGEEEGIP